MSAASYDPLSPGWGWDSGLAWTLAASIFLHLMALAAGLVLYPALNSRPRHLPPIYTVSLVSLPAPAAPAAPAAQTEKKAPLPPPAPPKEWAQQVPAKPPVPQAISLEKTKKPPVAPPPKPVDRQAEIDRALARVKGELQEKAKITKRIDTAVDRIARQGSGSGQAAAGIRGTGSAGEVDAAMSDYLVVIVNIINARWYQPPAGLIQKQGPLEGRYIIQITPSGGIQRGWFEPQSGDRYLDQSVEKAVARSNPLPPLPKNFKGPYFELGLRYTETGIANR